MAQMKKPVAKTTAKPKPKVTKSPASKSKTYKDTAPLSPKEKEGLKKGLDKIYSDSKKKAKAEVQKRKAPDNNWIARM